MWIGGREGDGMRRRVFNLAAAVSLLVCLGTVAVWVRSYSVAYAFGGTTPGSIYSGTASRGRMAVALASLKGGEFNFYHSSARPPWDIGAYGSLGRLGFFLDNRTGAAGNARIAIVFPIAVQAAVAAVVPEIWLVIRGRKRSAGDCCRGWFFDPTGQCSGGGSGWGGRSEGRGGGGGGKK